MGKSLLDYITYDGSFSPFGLPATEELGGRTARLPSGAEVRFDGAIAVKWDDDFFLAEREGRTYLVRENPDETLEALDAAETAAGAAALPASLDGWETDLCFASGYMLSAAFRDGALTLRPSPEPDIVNPYAPAGAPAPKAPEAPAATFALRAVELDDKRFLLCFPETGETVVLNARRFLLYAVLRGRITAGFVEVPPRERK